MAALAARLEIFMMKLIGLILVLSLAGCATCKSSDSPEVCRTKQRNHSKPRAYIAAASLTTPRFVVRSLPETY